MFRFLSSAGEGTGPRDTVRKDINRAKDAQMTANALKSQTGKPLKSLKESLRDDMLVLKHIWFSKAQGDDHASRLESFYGPQAKACA